MNTPKQNGFYMPAEFAPHSATIMIWCERGGSWTNGASNARPVFAEIIKAISKGENVYLAVSKRGRQSAEEMLSKQIKNCSVQLWEVETDDCWARDMAPTFITDGVTVKGIDWVFNAWGGEVDGLYSQWDKDDKFAAQACKKLNLECVSARPFVLEGGSIHSNGKGTVITTEECLLSAGRNPQLTKAEIEENLKNFLGADRVVWLPYGVIGDETNGHVDNICAFVNENTVVLGWTDEEGEQKKRCLADLKALEKAGLKVIKLPFPKSSVNFTQEDLNGFEYENGEIERTLEDNLAASYVNFYICNSAVIIPQFNDENDKAAVEILQKCFPDREIYPFDAREIIKGSGNVHCLTQQIPKNFI